MKLDPKPSYATYATMINLWLRKKPKNKEQKRSKSAEYEFCYDYDKKHTFCSKEM